MKLGHSSGKADQDDRESLAGEEREPRDDWREKNTEEGVRGDEGRLSKEDVATCYRAVRGRAAEDLAEGGAGARPSGRMQEEGYPG